MKTPVTENPTLQEVVRLVHGLPIEDVEAVAIGMFYYWVFRLNGKIPQGKAG